jgi:autotransporter-associated beta strand protein
MKRAIWNSAILAGLGLLPSASAFGQLAAFPGAVGFGADTTGGRTGSVYVVTNLNNSGTGSFRDAVSQSNRIVVFAVSGYIDITSAISAASNLTILGQTAPGGGIGVYGAEVSFYGQSNDSVQYMRFRDTNMDPGGTGTGNSSGNDVNLGNTNNMIFDHDSLEFASYNNIDASGTTGANNLTFQNSIIADPIASQQFNFHWQGNQATFINNIFANSHNRSILAKGNVQFVNNTDYNYQAGFTTGNSSGVFSFDMVNNYSIAGPSTTSAGDAYYQVDSNQTAYATGNMLDSNRDGVLNGGSANSIGATVSSTPWSTTTAALPTLSAAASVAFNLAHSGASLSHDPTTYASSTGYDQVDQEVIGNVASYGSQGSIFNEQKDDGLSNSGLGTITTGTAPTNTAGDGIADSWKLSHGLNVNVADSTLLNPLGYTMIEEYAAQIADLYNSQTWSATSGNWVSNSGNWSSTLPGDYDHALVRGNGTTNGSVTVATGNAAAYSLSIGGNGPVAGESVTVTGGSLVVYNTIIIGDQNNGSLNISGGTVTASNIQVGNTVWTANGSSSTTYTGSLILKGGILNTGEVMLGGGVPGNWTTGGTINWSGGTLQSAGALLVNVPAVLGPGGGILDTNAGTATISSVISGSGPFKVIGGGTLALTGANTFTNVITVSNAELYANPLSNAGTPGALGAASNAAGNIILDGGTLGGVGVTDHLFTLTANGGSVDNTGGLGFTNTGNIGLPQANVTLTLTGTNTGHEDFAAGVTDPGNGFVTSILKTGTGKWSFESSGNKTYSGLTTVSAGTLETLAANALSPNSTISVSSGAYVEMHGNSQVINGLQGAGIFQDSFNHTYDTLTIGQANGGGTFTGLLGNGLPNLIKDGTGIQILAGTDNYTGATTINGGVLQFNLAASIGGTGVSISIATGATAAAGYAMDQTTFLNRITNTSTGTAALAVSDANNLNFSTSGANLPYVSFGAVGTATYTGTVTPYGSTYLLGGGGGKLILPNNNAASGATSVQVLNSGIVDITGTNNYTGTTTITGPAVLQVAVLANGGLPSGIGVSSNAASNLILDGGTLAGAGSTDRLFTLTANGGTLDQSAGMIFTNTSAIALPQANVTLTLTGTNTGHETFSPTLTDSGNGYVTSVLKTGTGKWTFNVTGDKSYSGNTTVAAGTLETLAGNALSPNSSVVVYQSGDLDFHDSSQTINGLSGDGYVTNNFVSRNDTFTIGANNGSGVFTGTINSAATLNLTKTGTGTQTLSGANSYVGGNTTIAGGTLKLYGNTPIASYNFSSISGGTVTNTGIGGTSMNATLNGAGGTLTTTGGPIAGSGMLTLNGTGSSLDVMNPITDLSGTSSWTVSLWVKTNQSGATLFNKGDGTDWATGNSNFYLGTTTNGGTGAGTVPDAVRYGGGWVAGSANVSNGQWNMVTYTDNAGTESVYTNGVLNSVSLEQGGFDTADIGAVVRFGLNTDNSDGAVNLNGSLSDINFYNTALTQAQIQNLYTSNVAGGNGSNILPTTSAVSLTATSATLDIESVNQTIASLSGPAGSSVILGTGSVLTISNATSTEFDGAISGNGSLVVQGGQSLTLGGANTYTGPTNVASGTLTVKGSLASTSINISSGAILNVSGSLSALTVLSNSGTTNLGPNTGIGILNRAFAGITMGPGSTLTVASSPIQTNRTLIITSSLAFGGTAGSWQGQVDLGSNDAIIHNGNLATLNSEVAEGYNNGNWNGVGGIISSAAANDSSHLTALGVIQNSINGSPTGAILYGSGGASGLFDSNSSTVAGDVLIKYTYYGDTDLSGVVDGTDYSRIDTAYLADVANPGTDTGWYNGDFNYDGVINGSDYTLIDNAFNMQGSAITSLVASPDASFTTQVGGTSPVPEPGTLGLLAGGSLAMLGRRRVRRRM